MVEYFTGTAFSLAPQDGTPLEFGGNDDESRYLIHATLYSTPVPSAVNLRYRYDNASSTSETVALRSGSAVRFAVDASQSPIGYVQEGVLYADQPLKYWYKNGTTNYFGTAQFKGLSPITVAATATPPTNSRYVVTGVVNQSITPPASVPAHSQIAIHTTTGQLTWTTLPAAPPDADSDGFTDAEEALAGTNPNDDSSKPPSLPPTPQIGSIPSGIKAVTCYGDAAKDVPKADPPTTLTLEAPSVPHLAVLVFNTAEFYYYTRNTIEYNDTVDWSVSVNGSPPWTGTANVNTYHDDYFRSWLQWSSFFGYTSGHTRVLGTIPANPVATTSVNVSLTVTNRGDGALPTAAAIVLLPVEIEVKRGGVGNNTNNLPTTPTWRSQSGTIRDVVSVWDAHTSSTQVADLKGDWMQVRVSLGGQAAATLPENLVTWSIDGHPAPAPNTLETPRLSWPGSRGAKTIQTTVGGKVFKVHVDVPDVGSIGHVGWGALVIATRGTTIGAAAVLLARDYGTDETAWSSGYSGTPAQQNALRHSSWIAHCASAIAIGPALAQSLGYAHENDNFSSGNNWAYESTMDIHNNLQGVASVHSTLLGNPDTAAIRADVTAKLTSGALWVWDGPGAEHTGFKATLKSDTTPIFP